MSTAVRVPLRFRIGARTLWSVPRRLVRVALSLEEALAGAVPPLPPLDGADGWSVTSVPQAGLAARTAPAAATIRYERQRYTRYYVDLTAGHEAWWNGLSANQRSGLKRKAKRLAAGGELDVRAYRAPHELEAFHPLARAVSATTYQERLMDAGLPDTPAFRDAMLRAAAGGQVRAWILFVDGAPAAYLYSPRRGASMIYDHVGHDPRLNDLSPGAVLQWAALKDLFADPAGARYFDFTEGEGQHKRSMASGGIACVDLLLLRPTPMNRALLAALRAFDGGAAWGKAALGRWGLAHWAKRLRRG